MASQIVRERGCQLFNIPPTGESFFPSLRRLNADGVPFVHADSPGGTQVTQAVIDAISEFFAEYNSNPTREFVTSVESREMVARAREMAGGLLRRRTRRRGVRSDMTTLTWKFAHAVEHTLATGRQHTLHQLDHDANVAPWLAILCTDGSAGAVRPSQLDSFDLRYPTSTTRWMPIPG